MKYLYFYALALLSFQSFAQVKIGDNPNSINTYSLLELESTTKGLLLPRVTTANMNTMAAPNGMIIYNITENVYYSRIGGNWIKLVDDNAAFKLPYSKTINNSGGYLLDIMNSSGEAGWGGIRGQSTGSGNGVVGFSTAGNAIIGSTTSGTGGYFTSSSGYALTTGTGNVGIGTNSPAYLLDVNGRMRIRYNGNTAGLWFNKAANTEASFVGQMNDTTFGIYDNTDGWRYAFNHSNGHLGIGTLTPKYPLVFASSVGDKISLYGGSTTSTTNHYGFGIQGSLMQLYTPSTTDDIAFGIGRSGSFTENVRFTGDGNVGIKTNNPGATLHVKRGTATGGTAQFEGTTYSSHFNYSTSEDSYLRGGKNTSNVYINDLSTGVVGIAASGGSVGIGTNTPNQKLDIKNGRLRFSGYVSAGNSHGIEFTNNAGTALRSFLGQKDDNTFGFYGFAGSGWSLNIDATNGNVGIGTDVSTSKLKLEGGSGNALELSGGLKVSGNNKPAFVLVCDGSNLTDAYSPYINYGASTYYSSVIIDNQLSNSDPNAIIMVTPIAYTPYAISVFYDTNIAKWKIRIRTADVQETDCYGQASPNNGCGGGYVRAVMPYQPRLLYPGDKFNVMIIKQ